MHALRHPSLYSALPLAAVLLSGCVVFPKQNVNDATQLSGCLPFPNCVSSESGSPIHRFEPMTLAMPIAQAWPEIIITVTDLPNTNITHQEGYYLYAKSYSELFRFVDFVEVLADPATGVLHVRSSSLLGLSDLGVNRHRVEQLHENLIARGVVR